MTTVNSSKSRAAIEIRDIFKQVRKTLDIDKEQSLQGVVFDLLKAVDKASLMLNEAWKISQIHNLTDDGMRKEFIDIFQYFGRIKKDIQKDVKKN